MRTAAHRLLLLAALGLFGCHDFDAAHDTCIAEGRCTGDADGGNPGVGPPVIDRQPSSVTVVAGGEAVFTVVAHGAEPLTYEWTADTLQLTDGAAYEKLAGAVLSGSSTNTLRVRLVPLNANGVAFTARVRNAEGSAISDPATLQLGTGARLELVAGRLGGPGAADGIGPDARFTGPGGVAVDQAGALVVADTMNHTLRRVTPEGAVSTWVGRAGYQGIFDDVGAGARFDEPMGVVRDTGGTVYVADASNHCIRRITPAGAVTTLAGVPSAGSADGVADAARFDFPVALAFRSPDLLYVADQNNHTIRQVRTDGTVTTLAGAAGYLGHLDGPAPAAKFYRPSGVAVDAAGNVFVADTGNYVLRKVSAQGLVTTLAGAPGQGGSQDGPGASARFVEPIGLALDPNTQELYVLDGSALRRVTATGVVTTIAGAAEEPGSADGTGGQARFARPLGLAVGSDGVLFIADSGNGTLRRATRDGVVTTLAGTPPVRGRQDGIGGDARFRLPSGLVFDAQGTAFVADTDACTIRSISPLGEVTTIAGADGECGWADGSPNDARFSQPIGLAVSPTGILYVADTGNACIRRIDAVSRTVTTIAGTAGMLDHADGQGAAARFLAPFGIAVRGEAELFVSDAVANTIRHVSASALVTTLAGTPYVSGSQDGTGAAAQFAGPLGLAVSPAGTLFVADGDNRTIRAITIATRAVSTFAGLAESQGSVDGPSAMARFGWPGELAFTADGALLVTDGVNHTVRRIQNGTVSTVLGTPGLGRVTLGEPPGGLNAPFGLAVREGLVLLTSSNEPALVRFVP